MGFWIFMLIMDLLIPVAMIGLGSYFKRQPLKEINNLVGYRTSMSMKNEDTWIFAHRYCGELWSINGCIMLPVSIIAMILLYGKDVDAVGTFSGILCGVQILMLILSAVFTEKALKKTFDDYGKRRDKV